MTRSEPASNRAIKQSSKQASRQGRENGGQNATVNGARASRENGFYNRTAATSSFHKYKKPTKTIMPEATSIDFDFIRWQLTWAFPFPVKFAYICILREQIGHETAETGFGVKTDYTQKENKISIFLLQSNTQGLSSALGD